MPRVLIIATSRKSRGGITAVLKAYEKMYVWNKCHCHWVQTHRDGPVIRKLFYLFTAWLDFLFRIPFYDIVHVHVSLPTSALRKYGFVKVTALLRKKLVLQLHCGDQIDSIWNDKYGYMFNKADVCLFLSENIKAKAKLHAPSCRNMKVLYNPCPEVVFPRKKKKEKMILFSATLCRNKGYQDLIRAFSKISDSFPDWRLVLAGNGDVEEGRLLARVCGVEGKTEFPGWVSDKEKQDLFQKASVFCLPSYAEGFPMAVLDAWAFGLPVVTTPVGGIPDVAVDGENMLLFNPGDVDALSSALGRLMGDDALSSRISSASLAFACGTFSQQTIAASLSEIYSSLV